MRPRHCKGPYRARNSKSTSYPYGKSYLNSADGAASLLNSRGNGFVFDGAWNSSKGHRRPVEKIQDSGIGSLLCTSGGNSGIHCNLKVVHMWRWFNDGTGHGPVATIEAVQQTPGKIAVIQGDSGGPVLIPYANGKVGAVGMIQGAADAYMTGSACGSAHDLGNNICSKSVTFSSIRTIAKSFGASLVTG